MPRRSSPRTWSPIALVVAAVVATPARAGYIAYETPSTNSSVGATAQFTTSADTITVVLNNTLVNPTSVAQNISDLIFTVSTGQNTGTIDQANSSGTSRTVNGDGTFTDNGTVSPTHWAFQTSGSQIYLNDLSGGQPKQTIIGQPGAGGTYSNAGGSIAGNGAHNPFLYGPVTFTLDVAGVTAASTITAVTFSFNTTAGDNVNGVVSVPEPSSIALVGVGLAALPVALRRRRASADRPASAGRSR